ncbi:MAG: TniQ family protein [Burkholderiaceae bacterium]|nr:TniQ family protein [Burkholderiaceae bacterium]
MDEKIAHPLINLEPIGLGTDMAESLESYVCRVANAHRVPRYFIDLLVEGDADSLDRPKRSKNPTCLNTPSEAVQMYVKRLVDLTGRSELRSLGLGCFSGALSRLGVNRPHKAWCAECFAEWKEDQKTAYWPQVWSFPQYTRCHKHNITLQNKCKGCGSKFASEKLWRAELDKCLVCCAPLYSLIKKEKSESEESNTIARKIPDYAELAAHALADLVACVRTIVEDNLEIGTKFSLVMDHCTKHSLAETPADLAKITHMSRPTIHNLQHNEHTPCLENLLRIAVTCEVSLAGLLCSDLWKTSVTGLKVEGRSMQLPSSNRRVYYDWDAIEKQVLASIDAGTAEVPWVMARTMGLCEKQFCLKLGKTVYRLRRAALNRQLMKKTDEYKVMKEQLKKEIELAILNRNHKGRLTMARKLNVSVNNPLFTRAHAEVICTLMKYRQRRIA